MGLNLLKYFIHDRRDLSPAYVKSCEKFLKKVRAQARKRPSLTMDLGFYKIIKKEKYETNNHEQ